MDPVTHLLAGYVLGHAAFGSAALVAWTTFMAFFPDFDTVTWAFPKRFRWLRHRGATHSLLVGTAASALGAAVLSIAGEAPFALAFAAGLVGFLSHVLLDALNWGCLLLWPWRRRGVELTVQQGLMGPLVASTAGFAAIALGNLLGRHDAAVAVVGALWLAYLAGKLLLKAWLLRMHRDAAVYPTADPTRWRVIATERRGDERETVYLEAAFRPLRRERVLFASRHRVTPPPLPLRSPEDAAAFTFLTPEVQALLARDLALAVHVEPSGADSWRARWYALDYHRRGDDCFGALVHVSASGAYRAKKGLLPFTASPEPSGAP